MDCAGKKQNGLDGIVYLKPAIYGSVKLINDRLRAAAGVTKQNEFLFAFPKSKDHRMKHVKASKTMGELVHECHTTFKQLLLPDAITHTNLRKLMATKFSMFDSDSKLDSVARDMAHTKTQHLSTYRQNTNKDDAQMTKVLEELENPLPSADQNPKDSCTEEMPNVRQNAHFEGTVLFYFEVVLPIMVVYSVWRYS